MINGVRQMYYVEVTHNHTVLGTIAFENKHDADWAFAVREAVIKKGLVIDDELEALYDIEGIIDFIKKHRFDCHRFFVDDKVEL